MSEDEKIPKEKSKKPSKKLLYILIILIVILAECFIIYYDYTRNADDNLITDVGQQIPFVNDYLNNSDTNDPLVKLPAKQIGKNEIGTVSIEGPYGNTSSPVKVAYILGQHPREFSAHDAIYYALQNNSNELNYSYYVYRINVTNETADFEQSRMNGQLLAQEFVVNDSINKSYDLVIDIHSSNGGYIQDPYIFAPVSSDLLAYDAANNITKALPYITYYEPASYTSPQYSTIPLEEGGIASIVFEMRGNPDNSLEHQADDFVKAVDKLVLN